MFLLRYFSKGDGLANEIVSCRDFLRPTRKHQMFVLVVDALAEHMQRRVEDVTNLRRMSLSSDLAEGCSPLIWSMPHVAVGSRTQHPDLSRRFQVMEQCLSTPPRAPQRWQVVPSGELAGVQEEQLRNAGDCLTSGAMVEWNGIAMLHVSRVLSVKLLVPNDVEVIVGESSELR